MSYGTDPEEIEVDIDEPDGPEDLDEDGLPKPLEDEEDTQPIEEVEELMRTRWLFGEGRISPQDLYRIFPGEPEE